MVVVSKKSIEKLIEDVAPKVEKLTGWDTHVDDLCVELVGRDQIWEHGIKPKYEFLGIDIEPKTQKGKSTIKMIKLITPYLLLGQYEPLTKAMLIIPDNLRFGTNESGLAITIGHELVHRCQFANNLPFAKLYSTLVKKTTGSNAFDEDPDEDKSYEKYLQAYMTLTEGDASHVEDQLKKMFYQDAENKSAHSSNFIGLMLLIASLGDKNSGFMQKLKQYEEGKKIVSKIYEQEGRLRVNKLYNLGTKELYNTFGEKKWQ